MSNFVPDELDRLAELYRSRNAEYGNNYMQFGPAIKAMFPDGLVLRTAHDFNRMGVIVQAYAKFTRYLANFSKGGHNDSLDDLAVYAMMLKELDNSGELQLPKVFEYEGAKDIVSKTPLGQQEREEAWTDMQAEPKPSNAPPPPPQPIGELDNLGLV